MPSFPMRVGPNVMLMWMPIPGAAEYKILRSVDGGEFAEIGKMPMNNYLDPNLAQDKTYAYRVIAVLGGTPTDPSSDGVIQGVKPLDPPGSLAFMMREEGVAVRWGSVAGAAFYNLFKKSPEGDYTLLGSVQESKYLDTAVEPGTSYVYQVSAVSKNSVESPRSEGLEVAVPEAKVAAAAVKQYDFVTKQFTVVKVITGEESYEFQSPGDVEVDGDAGEIYVADAKGSVQVFDLEGAYLRRFGQSTTGTTVGYGVPGHLGRGADPGTMWVVYYNPPAVRLLGTGGDEVLAEVEYAPAEELLDQNPNYRWAPFDVAVDGQGRVWVTDNRVRQLVVFRPDGFEYLEEFRIGAPIITEELKEKPEETFLSGGFIRYDRTRNVMYATELATGWIKVYDMDGKFVRMLGGPGGSLANFQGLKGIDLDAEGNLIALDGLAMSIRVLDPESGDYLYSYVNTPENKVQLDNFVGLATLHDRRQALIVHPVFHKMSLVQLQ